MTAHDADQIANNNELLNAVASQLGCRNDAALAAALYVMPPVISKIRHGNLPIGATLQLTMLDRGIPLTLIRLYVPSHIPI
jgi:hypothetical protein